MTENLSHEAGVIMGAVIAFGPSLGEVVGSYMGEHDMVPADRRAEFRQAFAYALAKASADVSPQMALDVSEAIIKLAANQWALDSLLQGIERLLQPHIVAYRQRVALIDAVPMGSA